MPRRRVLSVGRCALSAERVGTRESKLLRGPWAFGLRAGGGGEACSPPRACIVNSFCCFVVIIPRLRIASDLTCIPHCVTESGPSLPWKLR